MRGSFRPSTKKNSNPPFPTSVNRRTTVSLVWLYPHRYEYGAAKAMNLERLLHFLSGWSLVGLCIYHATVTAVVVRNAMTLFLDPNGLQHRISGALQYLWLIVGTSIAARESLSSNDFSLWWAYNVILAVLGIQSTLSAAQSFPHRTVKNDIGQSGTLNEKAIVTYNEMIEHSFYQILNLVQITYLHAMHATVDPHTQVSSLPWYFRLLALFLVTSPWLIRKRFPAHSFRDNWKQTQKHSTMEVLLYQIKKWQYIFYKHAVLHSLNISMCVLPFSLGANFMLFWLCLNTSYVMEFFMQTMVKRKILTQYQHLLLQRLLMTVSSLSAIVPILFRINPIVTLISVLLNFQHRYHDVKNTISLAILYLLWQVF